MRKGKLLVVSGPSGVGKSTILQTLCARNPDIYFSVSATTRPPRPEEIHGVHYFFLEREVFQDRIEQGDFLEYAEYVGNYYGTPRRHAFDAMNAGRDVILDIEVQGARQVRERCPEAVSVFIAPPDWKELERRLSERGTDSPEKIRERLSRAKEEFRSAGQYQYLVVNRTPEESVRRLEAILTAEHCRVNECLTDLREVWEQDHPSGTPERTDEQKGEKAL